MHPFERACLRLRHHPRLKKAEWLWDIVRPCYDRFLALVAQRGLKRMINGTEGIRLHSTFRGQDETDEPHVWKDLMSEVQWGDVVADVGAYIGLYTIGLARRVGLSGRVIAFEPDPQNFAALETHVKLNCVSDRVELIQSAVGARDALVPFQGGRGSESHIHYVYVPAKGIQENIRTVRCVRLDTMFADTHLDILKIDVEGSEEEVLRGAINLLRDSHRRPRAIYIEVHPYAWSPVGSSGDSLLSLLHGCGYGVFDLDRRPIERVESYGQILALTGEALG